MLNSPLLKNMAFEESYIPGMEVFRKAQHDFGKTLNTTILLTSTEGGNLISPYLAAPFINHTPASEDIWSCCRNSLKKICREVALAGKSTSLLCECGLTITVNPIMVDGKQVANWALIYLTGTNGNKEALIRKAMESGYTPEEAVKVVEQTEIANDQKIQQTVSLLSSFTDIFTGLQYDSTNFPGKTIESGESKAQNVSLEHIAFSISQLSQLNLPLPALLTEIRKILLKFLHAERISFAILDSENNKNKLVEIKDDPSEPSEELPENSLEGYVYRMQSPLAVSQAGIELMIQEKVISRPVPLPSHWLGVPILTHDKIIGVIALQQYLTEFSYSDQDKEELIYLSKQISFSIQRILDEQALIKAKDEAEESSRLKSSLLANMSHELRTPMTGILGFSEILHDELEESRLKNMASTIYKSANRLMTTLNSIMDLSAIESNRTSLTLTSVNVKSTFMSLLQNAYTIASDKGLYLRTALPPQINVMADEKLLEQLLHHLLDNAIKFTIEGGVSISAFSGARGTTEVVIKISDTGIGIAPQHHKLIFEEFRQVSEGLSRTFEGSGLGLSLVSKIAKLINARVWVESVPEQGSDFYVALPSAVSSSSQALAVPDKAEAISTVRLGRGNVPEVLIVEDNEINRRLAALYLREICNIDMAENGYVAMKKIESKNYDAILMDINLGAGPNGIHIAQEIRTLEHYKNIPIIAVTGYTMQGDREKLLSSGCSHYVAKPYDKKTLIKLFSGLLYQQELK